MTVRIALALGLFALSISAAELTLEPGSVAPGKPAALALTLNVGSEAPTGFQFDLEYDAAALDLTVEAGAAAKQASKMLQSRQLQPGKLRVLIIGFNRNTLSGGILAVIHVSYKGNETGKSFPVHITASSGTDADAKPVAVTARDGTVKVEK
jgi:hypothetical protein